MGEQDNFELSGGRGSGSGMGSQGPQPAKKSKTTKNICITIILDNQILLLTTIALDNSKLRLTTVILDGPKLQPTTFIWEGPKLQPTTIILDGPKLRPTNVILYGPKLQPTTVQTEGPKSLITGDPLNHHQNGPSKITSHRCSIVNRPLQHLGFMNLSGPNYAILTKKHSSENTYNTNPVTIYLYLM